MLTLLCFGQATVLGSQGFLSQEQLVTESQRGLGKSASINMLNGAELTSPITFKNGAITL